MAQGIGNNNVLINQLRQYARNGKANELYDSLYVLSGIIGEEQFDQLVSDLWQTTIESQGKTLKRYVVSGHSTQPDKRDIISTASGRFAKVKDKGDGTIEMRCFTQSELARENPKLATRLQGYEDVLSKLLEVQDGAYDTRTNVQKQRRA